MYRSCAWRHGARATSTQMSTPMSTAKRIWARASRCRVTHRRQMSQLSGLATTPVDIGVDIDQKNFSEQRRQDGQGRRSRGGHVCPPCLDGPDSPDRHNGLGRPERAGLDAPSPFPQGWVRVVPPPCEDSREAGGVAVHEPCKCVVTSKGSRSEDQSARGASAFERWDDLRADEGGRDSGHRGCPTSAPAHRLWSAVSTSETTTGSFS